MPDRPRALVAVDAVDLAAHDQTAHLKFKLPLHRRDDPALGARLRLHVGGPRQPLAGGFELHHERQRELRPETSRGLPLKRREQKFAQHLRLGAIAQHRLIAHRLERGVAERAEVERVELGLRRIHRFHAQHPLKIEAKRAVEPGA